MKTYDRKKRLKKNVKKWYVYSFLTLLSTGTVCAQETKSNPFILSQNRLNITLENGFNKTQFETIIGDLSPRGNLGHIHRLGIDYTIATGSRFGINFGGAISALPFIYDIAPVDNYSGTDGWNYFQLVQYNMASRLKLGLVYNQWLNNRFVLHAEAGGGVNFITELSSTIGSTSPAGLEYEMEHLYNGSPVPYFSFGGGISRKFKNDNLLGLFLRYERNTAPFLTGEYFLHNYEHIGSYQNTGNNLTVGLRYSFTRGEKLKETEDRMLSKDISYREAKKEYKKQRRYIDPSSIFIGINGGLFFAQNKLDNRNSSLKNHWAPWGMGQLDAEIGMFKNKFLQVAFMQTEYFSGTRVKEDFIVGGWSSNAFVASSVSVGFGTRLIREKNNVNYLNISGGLALNINYEKPGILGSSGTTVTDGQGNGFSVNEIHHSRKSLFTTLYLNLSRDFLLMENMYLTFDYRFNLGGGNAYETVMNYSELPNNDNQQTIVNGINGTSNAFQLGIKYKFVPKG